MTILFLGGGRDFPQPTSSELIRLGCVSSLPDDRVHQDNTLLQPEI